MVFTHAIFVVLEAAALCFVAAHRMATEQMPGLRTTIHAVAAGDLTRPVQFESELVDVAMSDEIGLMARSFNRMQGDGGARLREVA